MTEDNLSFRTWQRVALPSSSKNTMLLTFDLEECEKFREKKPQELQIPDPGNKDAALDMFSLSYHGATALQTILEEQQAEATFFVTLSFAERYPGFIRHLHEYGHEIAVHAFEHGDNYRELWKKNPQECRGRILAAKSGLEELTGAQVIGFRAPQLQAPPPGLLKECGLHYDSSLHPTYVPGRYNHFREKRGPCRDGDFYEVPISVTPMLRLPFSWFWFRNLGPWYVRSCTSWTMRDQHVCNLYFHPWDFYPLNTFDFISRTYRKNTERMPHMFSEYLTWCKKKGYALTTVSEWLEGLNP